MTERQEATAAPAPWTGASSWFPAAPDRGNAETTEGGADGAVGDAAGGARAPGSVESATDYVGAPVPDAVAMSAPDMGAGATTLTGTGWPGPEHSSSRTPAGVGGSSSAHADSSRTLGGNSGSRRSTGTSNADHDDQDEPFARVDARKLEAALLTLRHPILTVPLPFDAPGVSEARAERVKLLSQIDDYLLPRLRQSGAPILVALVGSTGAGKSTLLNSLVGKQVSATGIRRPTTNSPVLACHPDDVRWFAENVFLPTLPRVRQQGLAMPGRDGLLVLATSEGMPKGVALLDTPDIDSVVQAHRDFAHQFLDASDLWFFVTTARRYADAAVWEMLKDARDRGAALALALSRVPPSSSAEVAAHFDAMLEANGLRDVRRFLVPETILTDSLLPAEIGAPIRDWLADTARREDRRVAVLTQTMSGVLDTFRSRVPALADQVGEQLVVRQGLRESIDAAYEATLDDFDEASKDGSLLRGEVLARWQDFAGTGDLLRTLQLRRGRGGGKQKKQRMPARARALKDALATSLESLIVATADRAAELVVSEWRQHPAGARLLADIDAATRRGGATSQDDFVASALADLGLVTGIGAGGSRQDSAALARATAGLAPLAGRAVASWQQHVQRLVRAENVTKRSIARVVSFDEESLAVVFSIGVLSYETPDACGADGESAVPQQLLTELFGAGLLRDMGARVRQDLRERVSGLFEAEARRYFAIIDSAGIPGETAASELLQASYALEAAR
jgi:GTPase SAR1 family protein